MSRKILNCKLYFSPKYLAFQYYFFLHFELSKNPEISFWSTGHVGTYCFSNTLQHECDFFLGYNALFYSLRPIL